MNKNLIMHSLHSIRAEMNKLEKQIFPEGSETVFTLEELIAYDPKRRSKSFFYNNIKTIPHFYHGKGLRFNKSEIDTWLSSN